jgi:hypothetical protein
VPSNDQVADIFTKALSRPLFENCRKKVKMISTRDLRLKENVKNDKLQASRSEKNKQTTTKPLIPNKLGYARNETQSESIRSKISNISDNNEYDERKRKKKK